MKTYCHAPSVPEELQPLLDLAYNLWWTTDQEATWLFRRLAPGLWDVVNHNPVLLLRSLTTEELHFRARNEEIVTRARSARDRMKQDLEADGGPAFQSTTRGHSDLFIEHHPMAAYFSSEFGIHESLPIYSGGLGVLAGDHIRSASDLRLPFCGIGLLYRYGYFHQRFSLDDWQLEEFQPHGFHNLPLRLVENDDGSPLLITLHLPDRDLTARVWLAQIGRSALYLLDTFYRENVVEDREITARLYDSDRDRRLKQEILLGIGGARLLQQLHISPRRFHMNEGHSAFLVLERIADFMAKNGAGFDEALTVTASSNVFTTHTPVAAGHEVFMRDAMAPYFNQQLKERMGIDPDRFFDLGKRPGENDPNKFEMTSLAMRTSHRINGVSRLHGEVARRQWNILWPECDEADVPVSHVTNGVHLHNWMGDPMRDLVGHTLDADIDPSQPTDLSGISDESLWDVRQKQRTDMLTFIRARAERQLIIGNTGRENLVDRLSVLDNNTLTIGFARRFATYKRAGLLFQDLDRLAQLLTNVHRPVQLLFAGKAHPADDAGKEILQEVIRASRDPRFKGRLLVLDDYDMSVARHLVCGVDVWLNTPRPPKEASGTSGMKAVANGALTVSTLDGWWVEAVEMGAAGWTIGQGSCDVPHDEVDAADAEHLFHILEEELVPLFYDRPESLIPHNWLKQVRRSMTVIMPYFNTQRMVSEYAERCYLS